MRIARSLKQEIGSFILLLVLSVAVAYLYILSQQENPASPALPFLKQGTDITETTEQLPSLADNYVPLDVSFANEALGGDYSVSGSVLSVDPTQSMIVIKGGTGASLTTRVRCDDGVKHLSPSSGVVREFALTDALPLIQIGDQFFGRCEDQSCGTLVSECVLVKS